MNFVFELDCDCNVAGTVASLRVCNTNDGQCACKARVGSRRCNQCADGFFDLQEDDPFGCTGKPLTCCDLLIDS